MSQQESFRQIKLLFGSMDDQCQERRRLYTDWAAGRIEPAAFVASMTGNLARTRQTASELEALIAGGV